MTIEVSLPVGRLVSGHPMVESPVKDDKTKLPKMQRDGMTPLMKTYVGYAIQKNGETDWKQTPWGQEILAEVMRSWPNGEHQQPSFSWKIEDGDSTVPNKKMKIPCERDGWPNHWIIHASKPFPFSCYRRGAYKPHQVLQNKDDIKRGDYCRMVVEVKTNGATGDNTKGMYINPEMFELYQAGVAIVGGDEPDAEAAWGDDAGALPTGALIDTNVPANAGVAQNKPPAPQKPGVNRAPPPKPNPAILTPPMYLLEGVAYSAADLTEAGYTPEDIQALPVA